MITSCYQTARASTIWHKPLANRLGRVDDMYTILISIKVLFLSHNLAVFVIRHGLLLGQNRRTALFDKAGSWLWSPGHIRYKGLNLSDLQPQDLGNILFGDLACVFLNVKCFCWTHRDSLSACLRMAELPVSKN